MGLERRGNNYYYYRKERVGSRVVSTYEGKGSVAQLIARLEELRKEEKTLDQSADNKRKQADLVADGEMDKQIDAVCAYVAVYVDALFLTRGYHQHSRIWRRKQNG
ncbi:MAG: hypothetical protein DMF63_13605 [Acidobacteria bacterium]|nr:MAG: hypothetical protein DMF63_13605 [Acidobacteriota bacterium]